MSTILAVDKAMKLLGCFTATRPELTLADFARSVNISKPTAMRLAHTLERHGILIRTSAGAYRLGFELVRLSNLLLSSLDLRQIAEPPLRELVERNDESAYLAVWQGHKIDIIQRIDCSHPLKYILEVGATVPLHAGSYAKAILAFLPEEELSTLLTADLSKLAKNTVTDPAALRKDLETIRRQGYAISHAERYDGIFGISAPIFQSNGQVVGSVSLGIPDQRLQMDRIDEMTQDVCAAARAISHSLGYVAPAPPDNASPGSKPSAR